MALHGLAGGCCLGSGSITGDAGCSPVCRVAQQHERGDRAHIQQFLQQRMSWGNVEQELEIHDQTGRFDVKRVQESSDTRLVVLAQERGPGRQFVTIAMNADESDPGKVAGIRVQPAQPPAELAPRRLTSTEIEAARKGDPYRQFSAWREALNSANRTRMRQFLDATFPGRDLDRETSYRELTGGLDLRSLEGATPTTLTGVVQHREDPDVFARFTIVVDANEPHRITGLRIGAIPRPAEFPVPPMSDAQIVAALLTKVEKEVAADRFAGTILLARQGKTVFSGAYGLADREKKVANTLDTRFRIGSMNKMFTAVAVLQLVQAGKIQLTDPLNKYVVDYPNQDLARKVTIHHLLTHTGGTGDIFGPSSTRAVCSFAR